LFLIRDGRIIAKTAVAMPASQIISWTKLALAQAAQRFVTGPIGPSLVRCAPSTDDFARNGVF